MILHAILNQDNKQEKQRGIVGIFLSSILSAALMVAGSQGTQKANMNAYHSGNKSSIEEANQLVFSGLRYTKGTISNTYMLQTLLNQYGNNKNVVLTCVENKDLPEKLTPTEVVTTLWTPKSSTQEIQIKAIFAPYDCDQSISPSNFRAAFEVIGGVGCKGSAAENSEICSTRALVMSAYKGVIYNAKKTSTSTSSGGSSSGGSSSGGSSSGGSSSGGSSSGGSSSGGSSSGGSSSGGSSSGGSSSGGSSSGGSSSSSSSSSGSGSNTSNSNVGL